MQTAKSRGLLAVALLVSCSGNDPATNGPEYRVENGLLPGVDLKGDAPQRLPQ